MAEIDQERKVKVTYECGLCARVVVVPDENSNEVMARSIDHLNNGNRPCIGLLNPIHVEEVA